MNCRQTETLLSGYLEGVLRASEQAAVSAHVRDCPACRRRRDVLISLEEKIREAVHWQPGPFPDFRRRAIDRWLASQEAPSGVGRRSTPALRPIPARRVCLLGAAALALVAALLTLTERQYRPPRRSGPPQLVRRENPAQPLLPRPSRRQLAAPASTHRIPTPGPAREWAPDSSARHPRSLGAPKIRRRAPAILSPRPVVGDLVALNADPKPDIRQWASLPRDQWQQIEDRVRAAVRMQDDFISLPFPRLVSTSERQIAQAVESYKREAAIVDPRLSHEVTCAFKATALSDLCEQLRSETGIQLTAGPSVADEKVTLFCEKMPLRDVMRQLSRPFGYTWIRSRKESHEYRYELVQDLRSQLLEEELRNRDRDAALIALDRDMNRYRQYLGLSPDEALARAETSSPEEKTLLEKFEDGWGPVQMYFRLSPPELAALRAGQELLFSSDPGPGEQPLPVDIVRGVLASMRGWRIRSRDGRFAVGGEKDVPDGLAPASIPEARALVTLKIDSSELGQLMLDGGSGVRLSSPAQTTSPSTVFDLATGISPAAPGAGCPPEGGRMSPADEAASARLIRDPALRLRVSVRPQPSCRPTPAPSPATEPGDQSGSPLPGAPTSEPKVTTADVLEALHRASGLPIVADFYTHLYPLSAALVRDQPLQEALNQLAGALRLRWNKEGRWLQFRSASFFADRLKEVPNRLLFRWAASRRQHGSLTLDDLIEIAQLSDAQLDSRIIAEGVKQCFGLAEWDLARFRPELRYLAQLTPGQRQAALSATGLAFKQMSLAQQQQFIARLGSELQSVEQLSNASLRVEYTQPGWFRCESLEEPAPSPVRERTREAALSAARRIDPQVDAARIVPTELAVTVLYTWGGPKTGGGSLGIRCTLQYTRRRTDHFPPQL